MTSLSLALLAIAIVVSSFVSGVFGMALATVVRVPIGSALLSRVHFNTKYCCAEPDASKLLCLERSRVCSAPPRTSALRAAQRPGTRDSIRSGYAPVVRW